MMQVAIDGPASAGKSTVAKQVAQKLGFVYIDTGAMYRTCTLIAQLNGIDFSDEERLLQKIRQSKIVFRTQDGEQKVYLDGTDVTAAIRTPKITDNVSQVSALAKIRYQMVKQQRDMAGEMNVIMDGRDIGTTVLPHAEVKIFLVASVKSRAKRRLLDYAQKGIKQNLTQIEQDLELRDFKDSHREVSPLKKADDAIEIDTTNMTIEQVVATILDKIEKKSKKLI